MIGQRHNMRVQKKCVLPMAPNMCILAFVMCLTNAIAMHRHVFAFVFVFVIEALFVDILYYSVDIVRSGVALAILLLTMNVFILQWLLFDGD